MKNTLIIFAILLGCFSASAQVHGYLGKRVALKYSVGVSPALRPLPADYITQARHSYSFNGINLTHEASLEFAAFRSTTIGASFQFFNSAFETFSVPDYDEEIHKISAKGGGLFVRHYTRGSYAFSGNFIQVDFSLIHMDLYKPRRAVSYNSSSIAVFGFYTGHQAILLRTIPLEYGVRVNLGTGLLSEVMDDYSQLNIDKAAIRASHAILISLRFGIGALII